MTIIMVMMMTIMMIMMMIKNMMMKIKKAIDRPNQKIIAPDFAWYQIQIIPTDDDNDRGDDDIDADGNGDDNDDDEYADQDHNGHNSANFQARSFRLYMIIDLDNT